LQVELIELTDNRIRFILSDVETAFANAIRRACLSEVPTLAIDEISIYDNTSVLFDEQIALRLGLIPLEVEDMDMYSTQEECQCGGTGCPGCQIGVMLSATGPGTVYSKDLQIADSGIKVAYESIPIVILGEGEKLMIEAIATFRPGTEHAKWQAGTLCGYKNLPKIEIDDCDGCGKCVKVCPRGILTFTEDDKVEITNTIECSLCKLCMDECDIDAIRVIPVPDTFVMFIEGDGSIPARELVHRASDVIRKKAEMLESKLKELA
jgi:DNA-directed RNA polymerase subunit D